ncbi:MAG: MarC family protein [Mariprofundaceae bacterium]|nr:MarC family protein [Mariprofundaceae bacterium]
MDPFLKSLALFLVLFNPFLMSIYLLDLIQDLEPRIFLKVLARAAMISGTVFLLFAWGGEAIFTRVLQVEFSAFLIFGGTVIFLIALQMLFTGSEAIKKMRGGNPAHISGSIAMPFMIGPGTISASVIAGNSLSYPLAMAVVVLSLLLTVGMLVALKQAFDIIRVRNVELLERYIDISGRAAALLTGTIGVQMILQGLRQSLHTTT